MKQHRRFFVIFTCFTLAVCVLLLLILSTQTMVIQSTLLEWKQTTYNANIFSINHNNSYINTLNQSNELEGLLIPPTMPSLIIVGPPKTGTSSLMRNLDIFVDLVSYFGEFDYEHHYWSHECNNDLSRSQWSQFIQQFRNSKINKTFSSIAKKFINVPKSEKERKRHKTCSLYFFYTNWVYYKKVTKTNTCWHSHYLLGNDPNNIIDINRIRNILNQTDGNMTNEIYDKNRNKKNIENVDESIIKDIFKDKHAYDFDHVSLRVSLCHFDLNCFSINI